MTLFSRPRRPTTPLHRVLAIALAAALAQACGNVAPAPIHLDTPDGDRCEILDPDECLLPFPSDALTRADSTTPTGRRVALVRESMPANASGVRIDPTQWNREDGFSPVAQITVFVPELSAEGVALLPPSTDIARSLQPDSPIVLLDATDGDRVPFWAELDLHTPAERRALTIHPARALDEGHRHVVALRGLLGAAGEASSAPELAHVATPIEPDPVFLAFRDGTPTDNEIIEARRDAMERVFADLARAFVAREDLTLAWDFTVASGPSIARRLLHMRDDAHAQLGPAAPSFSVGSAGDVGLARVVTGTFEVPLYLTGDGQPGSGLNDAGGDSLPMRNGSFAANFYCTVPLTASAQNPARLMLAGHGLLGTGAYAIDIGVLAASVNMAVCGTDFIGMSAGDIGHATRLLQDLSDFHTMPDRLLQSHLNFLFLAEVMRHPAGFGSHPAFQADGQSALDGSDAFYLGGSQGAILGVATTAVAQERHWTRAVMAVGGAAYSLLIPRSVDFDPFDTLFRSSYPDPLDQTLAFGLIQMLWDRGEASGYLQHIIGEPYPDTPDHTVLWFEAFGDHQVANIATEMAVRTTGAPVRQPALVPGLSTSVEPFWGIPAIPEFPWDGSGLVVWDFQVTPPPPDGNLPPREGRDPHGRAADEARVLVLVSEFLQPNGRLVDVCGGAPCRSTP